MVPSAVRARNPWPDRSVCVAGEESLMYIGVSLGGIIILLLVLWALGVI
jgi:hypothetical protein